MQYRNDGSREEYQIQKALAFLTPTCQMSREAQRDLMGASLKTTALLSSCR